MSQQLRTIQLTPAHDDRDVTFLEQGDVLIAAVGVLRRTAAGYSVRDTLIAAGVALPAPHQTLRVNNEQVWDLGRSLKPGDKLTIVNRVIGGSYGFLFHSAASGNHRNLRAKAVTGQ
jgi:hypothetical protein